MWEIKTYNSESCTIPEILRPTCKECFVKSCQQEEIIYAKTFIGLCIKVFICRLFNDYVEINEIK